MRRSWLAQATSWRRASNSSSIEPAISLKLRAELGKLARAAGGRARAEVAGGELGRRAAEAVERAEDPAGEEQRGDDGGERRGGGDGEDLRVVFHVEHHPAGGEHRGERQHDGEQREPGELEAHRGSSRMREARRRARRRVSPTARRIARFGHGTNR